MRDAMEVARAVSGFKEMREFDTVSLRLENIRICLMRGNPFTFLGKKPSIKEIDEIYGKRHRARDKTQ